MTKSAQQPVQPEVYISTSVAYNAIMAQAERCSIHLQLLEGLDTIEPEERAKSLNKVLIDFLGFVRATSVKRSSPSK